MSTSVVMRNSKVRTFLYVLLGCCMLFTVFLLSSTHTKLKESQESNDKCQQQRDSLSAQLQVVYEHKSRLEKTLQVEIADRKRAEDGVKLVRDQSDKDRADAWEKIKALQQQLSDTREVTTTPSQNKSTAEVTTTPSQNKSIAEVTTTPSQNKSTAESAIVPRASTSLTLAQAEEFKNLKSSYAALDQEKEKVYGELASHVALLQKERDAKQKIARQLEELQQSWKADSQVGVVLQKQLDNCRAETRHLYTKLQQQNLVVPQQQIASAGNEKPGASADVLAANEIKPAASFVAGAQQTELKTNAKEDSGAGKMGSRYQGAGAESRQPKQPGGVEAGNDSAGVAVAGARYPVAAQQALKPLSFFASQLASNPTSPQPNDSASGRLMEVPKVGAAPPLQQYANVGANNNNNSEQQLAASPQQVGVEPGANSNRLVPSQPGAAAKRALQPARQPVEPSSSEKPALAVKGEKQLARPAQPQPSADSVGPEAVMQAPQAAADQSNGQQPGPIQHLAQRRITIPAAVEPVQEQLRQPQVKPAEQPPVQRLAQMPALNQIPPVLPAPNLVAGKLEPAAGREARNHGDALDVLDNPVEDMARLKGAPVGGAAQDRAGSQAAKKKDIGFAAALHDENEVDGVANIDKAVAKAGVNYGKDLLMGGGKAAGVGGQQQQAQRPNLGRPNHPQHAEPENEDDLEYANAVGVKGHGADADQQQQQQQFNHLPEAGIAVNPK